VRSLSRRRTEKRRRVRRLFCLRAMTSELAVSRSQTAHLCQGRIRLTRLAQAIASPATQRHDRITFAARAQLQRRQSPTKTCLWETCQANRVSPLDIKPRRPHEMAPLTGGHSTLPGIVRTEPSGTPAPAP
jgi:hypothetical protein